jgi:hypothetical protein
MYTNSELASSSNAKVEDVQYVYLSPMHAWTSLNVYENDNTIMNAAIVRMNNTSITSKRRLISVRCGDNLN